jgi:hypothetical protein
MEQNKNMVYEESISHLYWATKQTREEIKESHFKNNEITSVNINENKKSQYKDSEISLKMEFIFSIVPGITPCILVVLSKFLLDGAYSTSRHVFLSFKIICEKVLGKSMFI